ncbi:MAG: phage tail protein [Burkholderiaceae bacterium]|nr:phage tail protein [Burkholderiaceae bacterium]
MDPGSFALLLATTAINAAVAYATAPDFNNAGPRLDDLNVVGSKYGAPIPVVHGRARVGGNIIWAAPLREEVNVNKQSAGKGSTITTTTYQYYGTFAALLCAGHTQLRPLRIWGDKKLLWQAPDGELHLSGEFEGGGAWEFAPGGPTQAPSAIMQARLGVGNTPAYRGRCVLYVSELPVDQFGRRLPQIEVELARGAPDAPAVMADVLSELMQRHGVQPDEIDVTQAVHEFDGLAIGAGSSAQLIEAWTAALSLQLVNTGERLAVRPIETNTIAATIDHGELLSGDAVLPVRRVREDALPREVRVRYLDLARDYQVSVQQASLQTGGAVGTLEIDVIATWSAQAARAACDALLRRGVVSRVQFGPLRLPPKYLYLEPGDVVRIVTPTRTHTVRLTQITVGANGALECEGEAYRASVLTGEGNGGDSGNYVGQQPADFGVGTLHVFDAPPLTDAQAQTGGFWWAAAGTGTAWRGAVLEASIDAGDTWSAVDAMATPSIIGQTVSALAAPSAGAYRFDTGTVDVQIVRGTLQSATSQAFWAGANLALIGDELVQFGQAQHLGGSTYRLSRLLRGRRGTEHLMQAWGAGARFVLMSSAVFVPVGVSAIGSTRMFRVVPAGSATPHSARTYTIGTGSVRPWSPVHVRGSRDGGGDLTITWFERSRVGTELADGGVDARDEPLALHELHVLDGTTVVRSVQVNGTSWTYTAAQQTTDFGAPQASVSMRVRRVGQYAVSPWATATL